MNTGFQTHFPAFIRIVSVISVVKKQTSPPCPSVRIRIVSVYIPSLIAAYFAPFPRNAKADQAAEAATANS